MEKEIIRDREPGQGSVESEAEKIEQRETEGVRIAVTFDKGILSNDT